mmetsp:Transcript_3839/g.9661  ORF Transcript_3839/g.9661 Transcript_3839/m.9661 type:complete len:481 (-) Transcript_3839:2755-4197(-)
MPCLLYNSTFANKPADFPYPLLNCTSRHPLRRQAARRSSDLDRPYPVGHSPILAVPHLQQALFAEPSPQRHTLPAEVALSVHRHLHPVGHRHGRSVPSVHAAIIDLAQVPVVVAALPAREGPVPRGKERALPARAPAVVEQLHLGPVHVALWHLQPKPPQQVHRVGDLRLAHVQGVVRGLEGVDALGQAPELAAHANVGSARREHKAPAQRVAVARHLQLAQASLPAVVLVARRRLAPVLTRVVCVQLLAPTRHLAPGALVRVRVGGAPLEPIVARAVRVLGAREALRVAVAVLARWAPALTPHPAPCRACSARRALDPLLAVVVRAVVAGGARLALVRRPRLVLEEVPRAAIAALHIRPRVMVCRRSMRTLDHSPAPRAEVPALAGLALAHSRSVIPRPTRVAILGGDGPRPDRPPAVRALELVRPRHCVYVPLGIMRVEAPRTVVPRRARDAVAAHVLAEVIEVRELDVLDLSSANLL